MSERGKRATRTREKTPFVPRFFQQQTEGWVAVSGSICKFPTSDRASSLCFIFGASACEGCTTVIKLQIGTGLSLKLTPHFPYSAARSNDERIRTR